MKVTIHSIRFDADKKLIQFVRERLEKLDVFYDGIIASEVTLRLEKSHDNSNKIAEIKLLVPGNDLFAKKQSKIFEEAVDNTIEALRRQLKKHKEKRNEKNTLITT